MWHRVTRYAQDLIGFNALLADMCDLFKSHVVNKNTHAQLNKKRSSMKTCTQAVIMGKKASEGQAKFTATSGRNVVIGGLC